MWLSLAARGGMQPAVPQSLLLRYPKVKVNTINTGSGVSPTAPHHDVEAGFCAAADSYPSRSGSRSPARRVSTLTSSTHAAHGKEGTAATPPARVRRDDTSVPDRSSDAFADYVLRAGTQIPLNEEQMSSARMNIMRSVVASRSRLADRQTTDMISNTLLEAMNRSPTFRAVVGYSLNYGRERLENLTFRNEYARNASYTVPMTPIRHMTASSLRSQSGTAPCRSVLSPRRAIDGETLGPTSISAWRRTQVRPLYARGKQRCCTRSFTTWPARTIPRQIPGKTIWDRLRPLRVE
jgi:hypothetical protein